MDIRALVDRWHEAVNTHNLSAVRETASDPVVVSGPQGAARITPGEFADWVTRSGIELRPASHHPITDRVMVVEQAARWPGSDDWATVATVFRTTGARVSAALRFPDLEAALDFAHLYTALAATEGS
ncbi:hypothetical protein [Paractinoplanes rishiriensis]|uniref:SnoaL-like domain-containing protein n=1 Tax=Paractinoplanes rishiriensis TaxID=1050105 RepID=A0A919JVV6_9ACTN|nr:hypothetical protein [Actinoplanes rishiriensis]GIE94514.1 hypothetical protein Ari01nite_19790 [Actinoplanes rishiriensis]